MATPRQNPVIGAIFLAWGPDGREREREQPYVDQVYLAPPVEPAQTLFLVFPFFFLFLFSVFYFRYNCYIKFHVFYFRPTLGNGLAYST